MGIKHNYNPDNIDSLLKNINQKISPPKYISNNSNFYPNNNNNFYPMYSNKYSNNNLNFNLYNRGQGT